MIELQEKAVLNQIKARNYARFAKILYQCLRKEAPYTKVFSATDEESSNKQSYAISYPRYL